VHSRRQFCADLEVYRPPEPLWNPRLREAATTLGASGGQRGGQRARNQTVRCKRATVQRTTWESRKPNRVGRKLIF